MAKTVTFLTLGCRVNQYESDAISEALEARGIATVPFGDDADLCVINTCSVTSESDRKSKQMIRRAIKLYKGKPIIAAGCSAENASSGIAEMKDVIAVGNSGKGELPSLIYAILSGEDLPEYKHIPMSECEYDNLSLTTQHKVRSFIKIEDGCDNKCAYCIIASLRGKVRSRAKESVIAEAKALIANNAGEIVLTGIETSAYGKDFDEKYTLADLIYDIDAIDGDKRLTLGSLEPTLLTDGFMRKMASVPSLLPHFHLSMQSGTTATLNRMRRRYSAPQSEACIGNIMRHMPDAMLSADVIVGFPGETDEDFADTVDFFRRNRFLHLHIFPFSPRKGTEAETMPNQVPEDVKRKRAAILADEQRKIKSSLLAEYCEAHRTSPVRVLFEQYKDGYMLGHTDHNVDVRIKTDRDMSGEIVMAKTVEVAGDEIIIQL